MDIIAILLKIPKTIIGCLLWVILQPVRMLEDFKENMEYYELQGRKLVHGREKGTESFKKVIRERNDQQKQNPEQE